MYDSKTTLLNGTGTNIGTTPLIFSPFIMKPWEVSSLFFLCVFDLELHVMPKSDAEGRRKHPGVDWFLVSSDVKIRQFGNNVPWETSKNPHLGGGFTYF